MSTVDFSHSLVVGKRYLKHNKLFSVARHGSGQTVDCLGIGFKSSRISSLVNRLAHI